MGYIYSREEMEETARRKQERKREIEEANERLPEPFKTFFKHKVFFSVLITIALLFAFALWLRTCSL